MKRVLAFLLTIALVFTMIPNQAMAVTPTTEANMDTGEMTVEGTNGFGSLLSQEINQRQAESAEAESEYEASYSVVNLTFEGSLATVEYCSLEEAILVVALYTEDGLKMLASGTVQVSPDEDLAYVSIEGDMPEYFLASAYLVDTYDFSPLCPAYDTPMYTQEMQELLASTVDDYDPDRVLNLDEDETTNFAVYAETTTIIEYVEGVNTVASVDDETTTYVIKNADEQFTTLQIGDVVAYGYSENDIIIFKVASITVDGTTVTITGDDTLEMEEVFAYVKIDGEGDDSSFTIDDSTAEEGVVYQDNSENVSPATVMPMNSDSGEASASISLSFEGVKLGGDAANVKLTGNGTLSVSLGIEYYVTKTYQRIEIRAEVSLKGTVGITGAVEGTVKLGNFKFDIIPTVLRLGTALNFVIKVEGKVEASLTMALKVGCIIDHGKQGWDYEGYCTPESDVETKFEGSLFVGLELEPNAEILYGVLADISLTAEGGREYTLEKELNPETSDDERHLCDNCFSGEIKWKFTLEGSAKFLKMKKLSIKAKIVELSEKIGDIYYTAGMSWFENGHCPNLAYKLTVNVVDTNDSPVKDAVVTAGEYSCTTDKKGIAELFLPVAEYELSVTDGDITRQHNFYMDSAQKVKVRLSPDGTSENIFDFIISDNIIDDTIVYISGRCGEDLFWNLDNKGRLMISGTGPMWNYDYGDAPWYSERSSITEVWFGRGFVDEVTSIGDCAFYDCTNLTSVVNADSVTAIGNSAFLECKSLTSVEMSDNLITIGDRAFESCTSLSSVEIPDSVTTIGASAFSWCDSLTSVEIPDSVTTIGGGAFSNCTSLSSVEIPDSVTTISNGAFRDCTSLRSVDIPDSVTTIGDVAFYNCTSLTSVSIPDGVTTIGGVAFYNCTSLTSVDIPGSVITIGGSAFWNCINLSEIVFQGNAPSIGDGAFYKVTATAYYPAGNTTWTSDVMKDYGGYITWVPYTLDGNGNMILNEAAAVTVETEETTELTDALVLETKEDVVQKRLDLPSRDIGEQDETVSPNAVYDGEYSTVVTDTYTLKTASFSGLVPCEQYVLLAMVSIDVADPLAADNLLYIDQVAASEDGTLVFQYVQRTPTETSYVVACGASNKDLNDAEITFPEMITDGEIQAVNPTVVYDGKTLTEGQDYTIQGTVSFTEAGTYTCYIRGVRNYAGLVECTYTVISPYYEVASGTCGENLTWTFYDNGRLTLSGTGPMTEFSSMDSVPWDDRRSEIVTVIIDQGVTTIGDFAFTECAGLTSITIADSVTTIGDFAFDSCTSLTSVTIPDSVTTIGSYVFRDCTSLTSATIGDGVTAISMGAFQYCSKLTSVTIGKSVTTISFGAFEYCTSLTSVTIGHSVATIGNGAFRSCTSLTSIEIPDSVTTIGDYALGSCTSLTGVTIPDSVTTIGNCAFYYCTNLTGIYVDENNPNYSSDDRGVLFDKEQVELIQAPGTISGSYEIPNSVTTIAPYAFSDCTGLTSVIIPDSVAAIGSHAFSRCENLCSVAIPDSVTTISNDAFRECTSLTSVTIPDSVTTIGDHAFTSCTSLTNVTIPDSVTTIGSYAFNYCTGMTNVEIPDSVTAIGSKAFRYCTGLRQITFMGDAPAIAEEVFSDVTATAYYPASNSTWTEDVLQNYGGTITWVPDCAEHSYVAVVTEPTCTGQGYTTYTCSKCGDSYVADETAVLGHSYETVVTEPTCTEQGYTTYTCSKCSDSYVADKTEALGHAYESVTTEGGEVTYTCTTCGDSYTEATPATLEYVVYEDHVEITDYTGSATELAIPDEIEGLPVTSIGDSAFQGCSKMTSITIPDSITTIGNYAFSNCYKLTELTIPDRITSIGNYAFGHCIRLTSITIPNSVTAIGSSAFYDCSSMTSITISDSITNIGDSTFWGCSSLTSIDLPVGVTSIGDNAFGGCSALTSISIPDGVASIGNSAFSGCSSLTDISIPDSVESIGSGAFGYCSSLTSISIPNGVNFNSYEAFIDCSRLTSIDLPDDITSIAMRAFSGCSSLTDISIPNSVWSIDSSAFSDCSSLTSITIPASVTSIGDYPFIRCSSLIGIYVDDNNQNYSSDAQGILFDKEKVRLIQAPGAIVDSCVIPASVTSIGDYAFAECTGLTAVHFNDDAPAFGRSVFEDITATAYYPIGNTTWTTDVMQDYDGTITWIAEGELGELLGLEIVSTPESGIVGNEPDISGLSVELIYSNERRIPVDNSDLTISTIDTSTVGKKTVTVSYSGFSVEFTYFVHEGESGVILDSSLYPESKHSYENDLDDIQTLTWPGATGFVLVFSESTFVENNYDWIYVYDGTDSLVASYTGSGAAGVTLEVPGDTVKIRITSDYSGTYYGYSFTSISTMDTFSHTGTSIIPAVEATCTEPGQTEGFICEVCDQEQYTVIPALGHDYESMVISPASGVYSYTTHSCTRCDDSYIDNVTVSGSLANGTCGDMLFWTVTESGTLHIFGEGEMVNYEIADAPWYQYEQLFQHVVINSGVTTIGTYAFYNHTRVTSVEIQDSVTTIGSRAFYLCTGLTSMEISDSVTTIGDLAFYQCTSLTSLEIPDSVSAIGDRPFWNCKNLECIYVDDNNLNFSSDSHGVLFNKQQTTLIHAPQAIGGAYAIPDGVIEIGSYAFAECNNITRVEIPGSVTTIGDSAFYLCSSLKEICVDESNRNFSNDSYGVLFDKQQTVLIKVPTTISGAYAIPESTVTIGNYAFYNCRSLTSIVISSNVSAVGDAAFNFCVSLRTIDIRPGAKAIGDFDYCTSLTSLDIPDGVTAMGSFESCTSLESVTIPGSVTIIDDFAFDRCEALTSIEISDGVTQIGRYAFKDCVSLARVTVPDSVTTIGNWAFSGCEELNEIIFKGNVPSFGNSVFGNVFATAYYPANNPTWTEDVLQNYGGTITWEAYTSQCSDHSHSRYGYDANNHWSICVCGKIIDGTQSSHEHIDGKCVCGAIWVEVKTNADVFCTVNGQTVTVEHNIPCRVGYWDETSGKYVAITAVSRGDGSYSFTAPEGVTEVLVVIKGNVNGDSRVTAPDTARLNAYILGKTTLSAEELFAADANGDGLVNADDRTYLSNAILGKNSLKWEVAKVEE